MSSFLVLFAAILVTSCDGTLPTESALTTVPSNTPEPSQIDGKRKEADDSEPAPVLEEKSNQPQTSTATIASASPSTSPTIASTPETNVTPLAVLSGVPQGQSKIVTLNIDVKSDNGIVSYRYKVGLASQTDCAASTDYGQERPENLAIDDSISGLTDSQIRVCVVGKNAKGNWQAFSDATGYTWTKDTVVPGSFNLSSPSTYSTTNSSQIVWGPASGASSYSIYVCGDAQCTNILASDTGNSDTSVTVEEIADGSYYIRVIATDQAGNLREAQNSPKVLVVDTVPPGAFSITSKPGLDIASPAVSWSSSQGADYYTVELYSSIGASGPTLTWSNLSSNSHTLSQVNAGVRRWLRVKAFDAAGNSVEASNSNQVVMLVSPNSWTLTSTSNAPHREMEGFSFLWLNDYQKAVFWGGSEGGSYCKNTGKIFELNSSTGGGGSWVSNTATSGAPTARRKHSAVVFDNKMLVWGGRDCSSSEPFNTGKVYDIGNVAWSSSSISAVNAPTGRYGHVGVWTGSKMLIWGGVSYIEGNWTHVNDGGLYDVATDTWTPISTVNAPTGREDFVSVWTGSKLIVWGGLANGTFFNSGGVYDPISDQWTSIATTGAPSPRLSPVAVWTGSKMVIWSGIGPSQAYYSDGAALDLSTNSWTTISNSGAPAGRGRAAAVWTGEQMFVWGGEQLIVPYTFNDGALYNPIANSWSAISSTNMPVGRKGHAILWTGFKAIVAGDSLNAGGVYTPP